MKPVFNIRVNKPDESEPTDITAVAQKRLIKLRVVDEAGIKSDALDLRLDAGPDKNGKVLDLPPRDREMALSLGYGQPDTYIGTYTVDRIEIGGPPDTATIRALATKWMTAFKAPRSASYSDIVLGDLVRTVAARYDYGAAVSAEYDSVTLTHVDQTEESDAHLLTRLARDYGAVFKPVAGGLVFVPRAEAKQASGKLMKEITVALTGRVLGWRYTAEDRGRYDAVEAVWHDLAAAEDKVVKVGDGDLVYRLRYSYPDEDAAYAAAEARYYKFQTGEGGLSVTIVGEPKARAECRITLEGFRSGIPTDWVATRVEHTFDKQGFRTRIDAELPKG